ncbi:MAG: DUF6807 family protein [Verrucomicrobiales bacterium]
MKIDAFHSGFRLPVAAAYAALVLPLPHLAAQAPDTVSPLETETFRPSGGGSVTYHLRAPKNSNLPVDSGGFFHPLTTPTGIVVTDLAPPDHRHHRGVFLAWVEMHGTKDADFWGWGEHAPIKDRRIVNRSLSRERGSGAESRFVAINDWQAEGLVLIREELRAVVRNDRHANMLDLIFTLVPECDITLSRWAYSGFCVRVRKDAEVTAIHSPDGPVSLPNPSHVDPKSDWPDMPWYAFVQKLADEKIFGAAVINHPKNPATLWHYHRDVRMLNPCIVAPGEVRLKRREPLVLRYRVVAFDGPAQTEFLNRAAKGWASESDK